jgi:hypothetical protein
VDELIALRDAVLRHQANLRRPFADRRGLRLAEVLARWHLPWAAAAAFVSGALRGDGNRHHDTTTHDDTRRPSRLQARARPQEDHQGPRKTVGSPKESRGRRRKQDADENRKN